MADPPPQRKDPWQYTTQLADGTPLTILVTGAGAFVCPVCGAWQHGEPPYHRGEFDRLGHYDAGAERLDSPTASFNICRVCGTHYGEDDLAADYPGLTQADVW